MRSLFAPPQKNTISSSGGDDDLEDLEIQRRTIPPRYNRRYATTVKFSSGQTTVYPNEDALRYSDADWSKGRVSGRIEMTDPNHDSNLGSGSFVFVSKLYKDDVKIFCYSDKDKRYLPMAIGKPVEGKTSGKPKITDLITVEIVDPKGEIERGKEGTCWAPREGKHTVKVCVWILGKRYCANMATK